MGWFDVVFEDDLCPPRGHGVERVPHCQIPALVDAVIACVERLTKLPEESLTENEKYWLDLARTDHVVKRFGMSNYDIAVWLLKLDVVSFDVRVIPSNPNWANKSLPVSYTPGNYDHWVDAFVYRIRDMDKSPIPEVQHFVRAAERSGGVCYTFTGARIYREVDSYQTKNKENIQ